MSNLIIGKNDALTVVDGNDDFINKNGALYVSGTDGEPENNIIIANIKKLFDLPFGIRVTTEDNHPEEDHIEYGIFGKHCVQETNGQKYTEELMDIYKRSDKNMKKGQDKNIIAYSLATSPDFPAHIKELREKEIKRVFVVGWAYTHCVGETAIAYAAQGFEVYVLRDATRSVAPPYGNTTEMDMKLKCYHVNIDFTYNIK